jgi:hypothetical protein
MFRKVVVVGGWLKLVDWVGLDVVYCSNGEVCFVMDCGGGGWQRVCFER